MNHQINI
ncbi:putative membrane protein, partial [Vibrio parahaemolyticus EKP-008]